jgi:hypothetical protein
MAYNSTVKSHCYTLDGVHKMNTIMKQRYSEVFVFFMWRMHAHKKLKDLNEKILRQSGTQSNPQPLNSSPAS